MGTWGFSGVVLRVKTLKLQKQNVKNSLTQNNILDFAENWTWFVLRGTKVCDNQYGINTLKLVTCLNNAILIITDFSWVVRKCSYMHKNNFFLLLHEKTNLMYVSKTHEAIMQKKKHTGI